MARVRVHQHVNPFSPYYRQEPEPLNPAAVYADPSLPVHLDIGCARGRFILRMAEVEPEWNFLGVEIRKPLVTEANEIAAEQEFVNLHYEFCNAMLWLDRVLEGISTDLLQTVSIQFPDPWFKKKHAKRRMVNAGLVATVVRRLAVGGIIFVQTDIEFLADEMFELFRSTAELAETPTDENPFSVKTEREISVENRRLPVYRTMFKKK